MGRRIIELYDAILSGSNAEISVRSTLQRRAGYIQFNSNPVAGVPQKFYSFQPSSQANTIYPVVDTTSNIYLSQPGMVAPISIFTKSQPSQSSFFAVGNYLFIGNQYFSKKWDTIQSLTNWGISIGSITGSSGPNAPTVAADVSYPGVAWSNPNNIKASDGQYASATLIPGGNSQSSSGTGGAATDKSSFELPSPPFAASGTPWSNPNNVTTNGQAATVLLSNSASILTYSDHLQVTGFGFNLPSSAIINGISFTFNRSASQANSLVDASILIVQNGTTGGSDHSGFTSWPSSSQPITFGGATDLWGLSWSPSQINAGNFGISLMVKNNVQPSNVTASIFGTISCTVFYTVPTSGTVYSDLLQGTGFGFGLLATNTITGILVEVQGFQSASPSGSTVAVSLLKNGSAVATKNVNLPGSNGFVSLGGSGDLWSATWTPNDVNQPNFGVSIQAIDSGSTTVTYNIDFVRLTIFSLGGPAVSLVAGTLTATQGFQYVFVYGDSNDLTISNPTPPSNSIQPNNQGVQISLIASTDPQVNQIRVFRTTDTGTGSVFFELPSSPYPNTTQNVVDNAPDATLQVTSSISSPTLNFSPPPAGLQLMAWYAGRMWGAVGNLLYFSAGPDNAPLGDKPGVNAWPPQNVFVLPTTIVKLVPIAGGNGMFVVTLDKIHVVQGIQNPGFTVNIWNPDIGARQQNAVDSDGSNIYVFTSDRQFLQITSQGINELSQYVSDQTDSFDPTKVYVVQHRSGSQDSRVFLSDGSSRIVPYNLMSACWETAQIPVDGGGVGAIDSIEISPGVYKFLKGATTAGQLVLQRDQSTFTDNGQQYGWDATFGNIPVADPTQLANVDSLVLRMTNAGNLPIFVGILPNDISGSFIPLTTQPQFEPPEAATPSTGHRAERYYLSTGPNLWQQMIHFQLQFTFAPSSAQEEILSWGIFPNESADEQVQPVPQVQGR